MTRCFVPFLLLCASFLFAPLAATAANVSMATVHVGNPGNAPDPLTGRGSVSYNYRIGKYEVTNAQYADFLNHKARNGDPLGLYHEYMGIHWFGGIERYDFFGGYLYVPHFGMHDKPVTFMSWYSAIRFTNWLHNGQGAGDTETGAYTILGGTPTPSNSLSITRNPGAKWWLPSEDEWYKAAYYDPTLNSDAGGYWLYPTRSNSLPTQATANELGDISNPGANVANYEGGARWRGELGTVTTVGSAGPLSNSYYGTADQGGNALEWNETLVFSGQGRGARGGAWLFSGDWMESEAHFGFDPLIGWSVLGFRVAAVPEPSTLALAAVGAVAILTFAANRRRRPRVAESADGC